MTRRSIALVVALQFVCLASVCLVVGDNGWDDGAITLAFARTFALHGKIALTPSSEVVEGFSSVSWFFLNGALGLARNTFRQTIFMSQIAAAACMCVATVLLWRLCARLGLGRLATAGSVLVFAFWGPSYSEAVNGMEMGLFTVSLLVIVNEVLSEQVRWGLLASGLVLALTTRFEAVIAVGLIGIAALVVGKRRVSQFLLVGSVAVLAALTLWRWVTFDDVVPNTVWAKLSPPYTRAGTSVWVRAFDALELPVQFLLPGVGIMLVMGLKAFRVLRAHRKAVLVVAAPVLAAMLVRGLVGTASYVFLERWALAGVPFVLALLSLPISSWNEDRPSRMRFSLSLVVYALTVVVSIPGSPIDAIRLASQGGVFGVTPHTYAETGEAVRKVQTAAELPKLTFMTPDIGGASLCCEDLKIIDLGLLASRSLAKFGYGALPKIIEAELPEVVEVHGNWVQTTRLFDLPSFESQYIPALVGRTALWVRLDTQQAILARDGGCVVRFTGNEPLRTAIEQHRYREFVRRNARKGGVPEQTFFERLGEVLVLRGDPTLPAGVCS